MMSNKWRLIIADAVDQVGRPRIEGFAINSIFESPDMENLPIMKIILNTEKFMR